MRDYLHTSSIYTNDRNAVCMYVIPNFLMNSNGVFCQFTMPNQYFNEYQVYKCFIILNNCAIQNLKLGPFLMDF